MIPEGAIDTFELVEPGHVAAGSLRIDPRRRRFNLADLLDVTVGGSRLCVWCNVKPLVGRQRRWCSKDCKESGFIYCNPQSPSARAWVLINLQDCACRACGVSHEDLVLKRLERLKTSWPLSYHLIGYGAGDVIQVDHIVPIHRGGRGFGLGNVQVICVACHMKKTIRERNPSVHTIVEEDQSEWLK